MRWTPKDRIELQHQIGSSHWLQVNHLKKLHVMIFRHMVKVNFLDHPWFDLVGDVPDEIRDLLECAPFRLKPDFAATFLAMWSELMGACRHDDSNFRCGDVTFYDNAMVVCSNELYDTLTIRHMPDCLIGTQSDETSYLRDLFLRSSLAMYTTSYDLYVNFGHYVRSEAYREPFRCASLPRELSCDADLLRQQISNVLEGKFDPPSISELGFPSSDDIQHATHVYELLLLNVACGNPVEITPSMLETAVRNDLPKYMDLLLGRYFVTIPPRQRRKELWFKDDHCRRPTSVTQAHIQELLDTVRPEQTLCRMLLQKELTRLTLLTHDAQEQGFATYEPLEDRYYEKMAEREREDYVGETVRSASDSYGWNSPSRCEDVFVVEESTDLGPQSRP